MSRCFLCLCIFISSFIQIKLQRATQDALLVHQLESLLEMIWSNVVDAPLAANVKFFCDEPILSGLISSLTNNSRTIITFPTFLTLAVRTVPSSMPPLRTSPTTAHITPTTLSKNRLGRHMREREHAFRERISLYFQHQVERVTFWGDFIDNVENSERKGTRTNPLRRARCHGIKLVAKCVVLIYST